MNKGMLHSFIPRLIYPSVTWLCILRYFRVLSVPGSMLPKPGVAPYLCTRNQPNLGSSDYFQMLETGEDHEQSNGKIQVTLTKSFKQVGLISISLNLVIHPVFGSLLPSSNTFTC